MRSAHGVDEVRAAEGAVMAVVPEPELMLVAAAALARRCLVILRSRGRIAGARVVLLVGSGNNGGDALFAGRDLARRSVSVTAIALTSGPHREGLAALRAAGGRVIAPEAGAAVLAGADLVIDGIVGIGGRGPVREPAASLLRHVSADRTARVAVDIPSGVDPDTGAVPGAVFRADVTVTMGCVKTGLILAPGRDHVGDLDVVDIGLGPHLGDGVRQLGVRDAARHVASPASDAYKYSHGVVAVVAGSGPYPGAAHIVVGAARHCAVGMVRVLDRDDGVAAEVVGRFPDVVTTRRLADDPRATTWVVGPGAGAHHGTARAIDALLGTEHPVVLDADALTVLARDPRLRDLVRERAAPTVITPHVGEFRRLGRPMTGDRVADARAAAQDLGAICVLKGPATVIADPDVTAYVDDAGPPALATAGTGDALAGILAALLSGHPDDPTEAVAAGVHLHGVAARSATTGRRPMTSWDLVEHVGGAVAQLRRETDPAPGPGSGSAWDGIGNSA